jgi:hypothetical protein
MKLNKNGNFYPVFAKQQSYNEKMCECVETVVDRLLSTETTDDRPGMLLGKIQSGKTRAFMGSIALAFDNGVDVAVIFTKGTLLLAEQTLTRINNDYETFISANELVAQDIRSLKDELTHFERNMKRVIVCMKEDDNVKKLINFVLVVAFTKFSGLKLLVMNIFRRQRHERPFNSLFLEEPKARIPNKRWSLLGCAFASREAGCPRLLRPRPG